LDLFLAELDATPELVDDVVVIAPVPVQKELGEVLRLRAVRGAAPPAARAPTASRRAVRRH
jgi:hypothetical protein